MQGSIREPFSADEERHIVERAQRGDATAISLLYNQYVTLVYRYTYLRVGNKQEAEDVAQDVFMKAFDALPKFEFRSSFKTWLFTITKATIVDVWRKKYKEVTVPLEDFLAHAPAFEPDPDVQVEEEQRANKNEQKVRAALSELPERYRAILELRFLKGYSLKEAAQELGIEVNNAKVVQFRALQRARVLANAKSQQPAETTDRLEDEDE